MAAAVLLDARKLQLRKLLQLLLLGVLLLQSPAAAATEDEGGGNAGGSAASDTTAALEAAVATISETPPILNFGSLDGYYRVLAGEIGIAGVRRYVCLAFVTEHDAEVESGYPATEAIRDAFYEVATLAQQSPPDESGKKVVFTEVPFPLDVQFGRKEHLAAVLKLDEAWVRGSQSGAMLGIVDILPETVATLPPESLFGAELPPAPADLQARVASAVLEQEPSLTTLRALLPTGSGAGEL